MDISSVLATAFHSQYQGRALVNAAESMQYNRPSKAADLQGVGYKKPLLGHAQYRHFVTKPNYVEFSTIHLPNPSHKQTESASNKWW